MAKLVVGENDLATTHPSLAAEWHPTRNGDLHPTALSAGSHKKAWWKCQTCAHEWQAKVADRALGGYGCPACSGRVATTGRNDLATTHPSLAAEWHPTKNGDLLPTGVSAGSRKKAWWRCPSCTHEWQTTVGNRALKGRGCPACANKTIVSGRNDLATTHPSLAAEWHSTKNSELLPTGVSAGSGKKAWWQCTACAHEWQTQVASRALNGTGCPACANKTIVPGRNDLATTHPAIAAEWHPTKNGELFPTGVSAGSRKKAWWRCPSCTHEWRTTVTNRALGGSGCPACVSGWTAVRIARIARGILPYAMRGELSAAEIDAIAAAAGMSLAARQRLIDIVRTRRLQGAHDETEIVDGSDELGVGELRVDHPDDLGELGVEELAGSVSAEAGDGSGEGDESSDVHLDPAVDGAVDPDDQTLPKLGVENILRSGGVLAGVDDAEVAEFLVKTRVDQLWRMAYQDQPSVELETREVRENPYEEAIRRRFRDELDASLALEIPDGWSFAPDGVVVAPNLMQRHAAVLVRENKTLGNWSGTGAGKTVSAVLAARVVGAGYDGGVVLVICPNNTIAGWSQTITGCFPDTVVDTKTLVPSKSDGHQHFLVVNFERFSTPEAAAQLEELLAEHRVDMLVVDEVHFTKARVGTDDSRRRETITKFRHRLQEVNPEARVLVMSATPVVNELHEAKSLLEVLLGEEMDHLPTRHTVSNAFAVHRQLVANGIRWMPDYSGIDLVERTVLIDVGHLLEDLLALGRHPSPLDYEALLIDAKLETIVDACSKGGKSLVYTEYLAGIVDKLVPALEAAGLRVGQFTGERKELERFVGHTSDGQPVPEADRVDVLIGSSAVGTGVDGLQHHASRLVFATLPWTAAGYEQVRGRIWRQGRPAHLGGVEVVIPLTYLDEPQRDGRTARWSWCEVRLARLTAKRTLSEAAVDGVMPKGGIGASAAKVAADVAAWLARLVAAAELADQAA